MRLCVVWQEYACIGLVFSGLVPYFGGWWIRKRPDPEIWSLLLISLSILDNLLKKENYFCENLGNSFIYALDLLAQSTPRWTFPALYQDSHALIIFCGWPLPLIKKKDCRQTKTLVWCPILGVDGSENGPILKFEVCC